MRRFLLIVSMAALLVLMWGCYGMVYVREHPPVDRVEVIGVAPSPAYVWIGGYWRWDRHWHWVPGHWERRPHRHAEWIRGYWSETPRGWIWIEGRWRD
jgi:hypothetical protein